MSEIEYRIDFSILAREPGEEDFTERGQAMIPKLEVSRSHATLPNCDGCGRFTSNPDVRRWCEGYGDWHACYERLLCPKCAEREAKQ